MDQSGTFDLFPFFTEENQRGLRVEARIPATFVRIVTFNPCDRRQTNKRGGLDSTRRMQQAESVTAGLETHDNQDLHGRKH